MAPHLQSLDDCVRISPRSRRSLYAHSMSRSTLTFALAALAACNTPRPPVAPPPNRPSAVAVDSGVAPSSVEPTLTVGRASWTGRCAEIVSRMLAVKARLPSACASDNDCACYPGGIDAVTGCGGASDGPTSAEITRIQTEFSEARCNYRVNCSPRACNVGCVRGRCAERG